MEPVILFLSLLTGGMAWITRDVRHPSVLMPGCWLVLFLATRLAVEWAILPITPVSSHTCTIIAFCIAVFSLGALASGSWSCPNRPAPARPPVLLERVLYWVPVIGLPLLLAKALLLFTDQATYTSFLPGLRHRLTELGGSDFGILEKLVPISLLAAAYRLHCTEQEPTSSNRYQLGLHLVILLAILLLMTGRTYLLHGGTVLAGLLLFSPSRTTRKLLGLLAVGFLVSMFAVSLLLNKSGHTAAPGAPQGPLAAYMWYLVGPLQALDHTILFGGSSTSPVTEFTNGFLLLTGLVPPETARLEKLAYLHVPYGMNVRTLFSSLASPNSFIPVFMGCALAGFLHGLFYVRAKAGCFGSRLGYGLMLYALCLSFFANAYLGQYRLWLQYLLLYAAFFWFFVPGKRRAGNPAQLSAAASP